MSAPRSKSPRKNRPFGARLVVALHGIAAAWRRERSFRTQTAVALLAMSALIALRPPLLWWAIVVVAMGLVLGLELMNSALEALVDHLHPDEHPEVRLIKDMAAGGVLLGSVAALVVAVLFAVAMYMR